MKHVSESVDKRLKGWCIYCGDRLGAKKVNHDHVPSRTFLKKPFPPKLPRVPCCVDCNEGFAADEQYMWLFLRCLIEGTTNPEEIKEKRVVRAFEMHPALNAQIKKNRVQYETLGGETKSVWRPNQKRFRRVIEKNARGHVFFELSELSELSLNDPETVSFCPLESLSKEIRKEFETVELGVVFPELGSRMMTRMMTGVDLVGSWVNVQKGNYRYAVTHGDGILVRSVIYEHLACEVYWAG